MENCQRILQGLSRVVQIRCSWDKYTVQSIRRRWTSDVFHRPVAPKFFFFTLRFFRGVSKRMPFLVNVAFSTAPEGSHYSILSGQGSVGISNPAWQIGAIRESCHCTPRICQRVANILWHPISNFQEGSNNLTPPRNTFDRGLPIILSHLQEVGTINIQMGNFSAIPLKK